MTIKNQWLKKPNVKNEDIIKLYQSGLTGTQIGIKLGLAKGSVTKRLKKLGFQLRKSSSYTRENRYWLWKGNDYIDPVIRKYNQRNLRKWSLAVRTRDGNKCIDCGRSDIRLHSHHIVKIQKSMDTPLEFDISNGITLCPKCHKNRHKALRDGN